MSMKTSTNVFKPAALIAVLSLLLMGQSCSIPFFGSKQDVTDGGVFRSDDHVQTWRQKNVITTSKANGSVRNVSNRNLVPERKTANRWFAGTAALG